MDMAKVKATIPMGAPVKTQLNPFIIDDSEFNDINKRNEIIHKLLHG